MVIKTRFNIGDKVLYKGNEFTVISIDCMKNERTFLVHYVIRRAGFYDRTILEMDLIKMQVTQNWN